MTGKSTLKIGIAGCGALGSIAAKTLLAGEIPNMKLCGISEMRSIDFNVPRMSFAELGQTCDVIVEALPATAVPELAAAILPHGKTIIMVSACALLIYPDILDYKTGRIILPSGALGGLDAVAALKNDGISEAKIISTKPPKGFALTNMAEKTLIFEGNALEAAQHYPANVNVAATLSFAGIGPDATKVELWADPTKNTNSHEIEVVGRFSTIRAKIDNTPDPQNPKSSILAGHSLVSCLQKLAVTNPDTDFTAPTVL